MVAAELVLSPRTGFEVFGVSSATKPAPASTVLREVELVDWFDVEVCVLMLECSEYILFFCFLRLAGFLFFLLFRLFVLGFLLVLAL